MVAIEARGANLGVTPSRLQNLRLRGLVKGKRVEADDALAKRGKRYVYLQQSLVERFGPRDTTLSPPMGPAQPGNGTASPTVNATLVAETPTDARGAGSMSSERKPLRRRGRKSYPNWQALRKNAAGKHWSTNRQPQRRFVAGA